MALLGVQLVITLVVISIIQKLSPYFSFSKWFLCSTGLVRYLYPTDNELRQLANIPKDKLKNKKPKNQHHNGNIVERFHIPRNLDVELKTSEVIELDVIHLRFFTEYQWLLDFSIYSFMVYVATEVYQMFFKLGDEINLSMLWCLLVLMFSVKILLSLTVVYFKADESIGERSTCLVMGFIYLIVAMVVLIIDEETLELGLETAYSSFNKSASAFVGKQGLVSSGPASKLIIKLSLALWGALLGALFTFPGLRIARMHWDLIKSYKQRKAVQLLLNVGFALPFLLVVAWVKPVARNYLTVRIFSKMSEPLLSTPTFESVRLIVAISAMGLKIFLMPLYLQAYLNMARDRVEEQKKEAGRITNIDFQKKIAAIFYYLCVVSLQYLAPVVMCIYFTLMLKTLGGYSWTSFESDSSIEEKVFVKVTDSDLNVGESIVQTAQQFHLTLENLKSIFTVEVFRGLLGFCTWWCCFVYFTSTSIGMIYQSYFTRS